MLFLNSSMTPSPQTPTRKHWITPVIIGLAMIGFADATFLTVEHYRGSIIPCSITTGCQVVTTSKYSTIGPVPIALMGGLYYLTVLILAAVLLEDRRRGWWRWMPWLTASGFVFSLYLVALQAFVLNAFCLYCLVSAGTSTLIFIFSLLGRRKNTKLAV